DYGYQKQTVTTKSISSGETVQTDINLDRETEAELSGTVYDNSGHGYPLYATLLFETPNYSEHVFSNPFNGNYTIMVYENTTYDITVVSEIRGYQKITEMEITFSGPSATRDFQLPITTNCTAPGYETVKGLYESFPQETLPDGWTVVDHIDAGVVWRFDDPGLRMNLTGGSGPFAIIDSDYAGTVAIDTSLISPSVDMSGESTVTLSFDQDFNEWGGGNTEKADVEVSVDGGVTWNLFLRQTSDVRGPDHQVIDISTHAAGQSDVRVRFHYYDAEFEWWWQVDNISIEPFSCNLVDGGAMAGFVNAANTGEPVNEARIESSTSYTFSDETLLDTSIPDGFYWLFQAMTSDPQTITYDVTRPAYYSLTEDVTLSQDAVTRMDFLLDSFILYLSLLIR
ncbi:MAG: choice-of-anchor J domain-containing protein, partial [Brevefilum sp.]